MIHHSCFSLILSSFSRVRLQCIPREEETDIISAQGQEEGELTLHLQLPEMLSFLKGSGPAEASSHLPPSLQACLSPWKINSLPQDTEDMQKEAISANSNPGIDSLFHPTPQIRLCDPWNVRQYIKYAKESIIMLFIMT